MLILLITLKTKLFTYYTAFCMMDAGSIASGLSYNGLDSDSKFHILSKKINREGYIQ